MSFLGFAPHGITLKELLENPDLQNPPQLDKNNGEGKKGENAGGIDVTSAFLGPNLWNNNYEDNDFSLEYMDLDEFLCENGIPVILDDNSNSTEKTQSNSSTKEDQSSSPQRNSPGLSIDPFIPQSQSPQSSRSSPEPTSPSAVSPLSPSSPKEDKVKVEDGKVSPVVEYEVSESDLALASIPVHLSLQEQYDDDDDEDDDDDDGDGEDQLEPVSKKKVNFVVESDDLALVNVPGQDNFDPRRRKFTAEELKPQPIIKKSRKVFVPDDCKDEKYWSRRRKNNVAAKRSRDARRIKENQIAMRASFLERENIAMKEELRKLKEENLSLKKTIRKYEPGACLT